MKILITGASGLIGSALVEYFVNQGHTIFSLQRNKKQGDTSFWNLDRLESQNDATPFNAVIHLAGENIATGRWTRKKRKRIIESRIKGTQELASYCANLKQKPEVFISASAIGYYGNREETVVDENSQPGNNFVAEVCQEWEKASQPAHNAGIRVIYGRIGMVLSGHGGTLLTMVPSFKMGIAGIVGNGRQFVSWVDIKDIVGMFHFLIEHDSIQGPVNLVSPEPTTNLTFTKTLGKILQKPTIMRMPAFVARLVFGQMGEELVLSSTRVIPGVLKANKYDFVAPDLEHSLKNCLETLMQK